MPCGRNQKRRKLPSNRWTTRRYKEDGNRKTYYVLKDGNTGKVIKRRIHPYFKHNRASVYRRIADEEMRNRGDITEDITTTRYEGRKEDVDVQRTESDEALSGEVALPIKGLPITIKGRVGQSAIDTPKSTSLAMVGEGRKTFEQIKGLIGRKKEEPQ